MEQLLNDLIKYYLEEAAHPIIDIPQNYVNKREFLRGLLNVREAKPVPIEIIEKENEFLRLEQQERKIFDINNFDKRLFLWQGDITSVKCDSIVHLTDGKMLGCRKPNHNCTSNKINTYAGVVLRLKCKEIIKGQEVEVSKVILTDGFNLPCDKIIHVVKPEFEELTTDIKEIIKNMYINVLELAKKNNIKTIAIPNFAVKSEFKEEVSNITINTIKEYLNNNPEIEKVMFNVYTLDDFNTYSKLLEEGEYNESN